jgi:hypothetical protein
MYVIQFGADDGNGGSCTGAVTVTVPHSKNSTAVDTGQFFAGGNGTPGEWSPIASSSLLAQALKIRMGLSACSWSAVRNVHRPSGEPLQALALHDRRFGNCDRVTSDDARLLVSR